MSNETNTTSAVGRPPIGPEVKTRITPDEATKLSERATLHGIDRSELIRRYIRDGLAAPDEARVDNEIRRMSTAELAKAHGVYEDWDAELYRREPTLYGWYNAIRYLWDKAAEQHAATAGFMEMLDMPTPPGVDLLEAEFRASIERLANA